MTYETFGDPSICQRNQPNYGNPNPKKAYQCPAYVQEFGDLSFALFISISLTFRFFKSTYPL
jgi:hypothetical protein